MKIKYVVMVTAALFVLGFAMHRGLTQSTPVVVGPGYAPNAYTPADPRSLSYYGGYYGGYTPQPLSTSLTSLYNVSFGPADIPQTSSKITTKLTTNSFSFQWEGEPRAIQSITVSLVDKNNASISTKTITALPAKTTLKRTTKAVGYTVNIEYINGQSNTISSAL